jgi:hypothetical protein
MHHHYYQVGGLAVQSDPGMAVVMFGSWSRRAGVSRTARSGWARTMLAGYWVRRKEERRMAVLIYFQKAQEDATTVEYAFGYPEMNRSLVIEKETQQAHPSDGTTDTTFAAVVYKILATRAGADEWPEAGSYAA